MEPLESLDTDSVSRVGAEGTVERIGTDLVIAETMFQGLRLPDRLMVEDYKCRFSYEPPEIYGQQFRELRERG